MEHLANIWNLIEISFVRGKWLKFRYIARDSCLSPHILIRKGKKCFTIPTKKIYRIVLAPYKAMHIKR